MTKSTRLSWAHEYNVTMWELGIQSFGDVDTLTFDAETSMEGPEMDPSPYGPSGARVLLWAYKRSDNPAMYAVPPSIGRTLSFRGAELLVQRVADF